MDNLTSFPFEKLKNYLVATYIFFVNISSILHQDLHNICSSVRWCHIDWGLQKNDFQLVQSKWQIELHTHYKIWYLGSISTTQNKDFFPFTRFFNASKLPPQDNISEFKSVQRLLGTQNIQNDISEASYNFLNEKKNSRWGLNNLTRICQVFSDNIITVFSWTLAPCCRRLWTMATFPSRGA